MYGGDGVVGAPLGVGTVPLADVVGVVVAAASIGGGATYGGGAAKTGIGGVVLGTL